MQRAAVVVTSSLLAVLVCVSTALAGRIVRVGQRANGTKVVLHRSDTLVVSLPGNASTGYSWRLRTVDHAVVKPTSSTYIPRKPVRPGTGGTYVLRFRAVAEGQTRLKLVYVQAGSSNTRPARTFTLRLFVIAAVT